MKKIVLTLTSLFITLPFVSFAHEGHGAVNTGPAHYLLTPEHALPIVAVVAMVGYFVGKRLLKKT